MDASKVLILLTVAMPLVSLENESTVSQKMEKHRVVPDIIPVAPPNLVTVTYKDNVAVNLGNELTPTQVHDKPTISWPIEDGALYTLIMNDPDVPPQIAKEVQHWLVVNIPGNDISKGETLFEYVGSGPPKGTALHRYIFLVYKQRSKLEPVTYQIFKDEKLGKLSTRLAAPLHRVLKELTLDLPVAANYYVAQYDDNVPHFRKELQHKFQ